MRTILAGLLIFVAAVLTLPGSLAVFEQRDLVNEDKFVDLGNKVLEKDAVQQDMANSFATCFNSQVNDIFGGIGSIFGGGGNSNSNNNNDLNDLLGSIFGDDKSSTGGNKQPPAASDDPVKGFALGVVKQLPNSIVSDVALRVTHGLVVNSIRDPKTEKMVLDFSNGIGNALGGLGLNDTQTKAADSSGCGSVTIQRSDLSTTFHYARIFDKMTLLFELLPVLVLAAGLIITAKRELYCLVAGVAMAVAGVLWILLAKGPLEGTLTNSAIHDDSSAAAVHAAYGVVVSGFVQQEFILIGAGVVLAIVGAVLTSRAAAKAR